MTAKARVIIAAWIAGASILSCSRQEDPNDVADGSSNQKDAAGSGSGGVGGDAGASAVGGAAGSSGDGSGGSGASGGSGGAGGHAGSAGGKSGSAGAGATGGTAGTGAGGVGGNGGLAGSGGRSGSDGVDGGGSGGSSTGGNGGSFDSGGPGGGGTVGTDGGPIVCSDSGGGSDAGGAPDGATTTVVCVSVYDDDKITYAGSAPLTYACDECKSSTYPTGPNACRNASDCSLLATGMVGAIVRNCTLSCRSQEPPSGSCAMAAECNAQCVKNGTATRVGAPGLSDECGKCHTHAMMCRFTFCLGACTADPDAIECIKCEYANGCMIQFQRCTGLDPR